MCVILYRDGQCEQEMAMPITVHAIYAIAKVTNLDSDHVLQCLVRGQTLYGDNGESYYLKVK